MTTTEEDDVTTESVPMSANDKFLDELDKSLLASASAGAVDKSDADIINDQLTLNAGNRFESKPDIDHLEDALDDDSGLPKFSAGDKVVIERYITTMPGNQWLDTRLVQVVSVDLVSGDMKCLDPELRQNVFCNFRTAIEWGYRIKLSPRSGPSIGGKRRRGRPRVNPPVIAQKPERDAAGNIIKKKRGRRKGTKNRDKATIAAEKLAKEKERFAKRAMKKARRA